MYIYTITYDDIYIPQIATSVSKQIMVDRSHFLDKLCHEVEEKKRKVILNIFEAFTHSVFIMQFIS